ncbi:FAD:protein FMN transferase [bacterium]|jgi:FAD:protein FMN transferase|nr:FAD:protein FMN transferase [bacterium]
MKIVRLFPITILFLLIGLGLWITTPKEVKLSGMTMGTNYSIRYYASRFVSEKAIESEIATLFGGINQSLSTYELGTNISEFNQFESQDVFEATPFFYDVLSIAQIVYQKTGGAWDGTVWPLYQLWGFDQTEMPDDVPEWRAIRNARRHVSFGKITLIEPGRISKTDPLVMIDLSSIAKGYTVDKVAEVLVANEVSRFYVEIGGEIRVQGKRPEKKLWRIGIQQPSTLNGKIVPFRIITLTDASIATSGDYRQFFKHNGRLYSHVIDPKTGMPVQGVASVTVVAPECAIADGLATALMVMGPEEGLSLIESMSDVEGLIVERIGPEEYKDYMTSGFAKLILR